MPVEALIVDNFDSFTYNILALLNRIGIKATVVSNDSLRGIGYFDRVIISPGPGNPNIESDRGDLFEFLDSGNFGKILGICFGHEALGIYLGGTIYRTERPMHGEVDRVKHFGGDIFRGVPDEFEAIRYHSLALKLPRHVLVKAVSSTDGTVMAFSSSNGRFSGLQFHPESFYSQFGNVILSNFMGD
ncbi:MAG: aminodeoxychorismate/anthranilate synthase component II [Candidatus Thermoplasmatota archaeon]|jgi:anthranilate synthase component 2|nr:aminodeoxychorismate/anthranilate synthase component II [Candidatus Thermoplasmatota archaeon]MCL5800284.1 aminodeoxychorismate/anthranilate synthase component II [Candidatus Thermoplasmatota archaeon]